jgi:hypothetical protein
MELLAAKDIKAAELADGFLGSVAQGTVAHFDDDRMFAHRLGNLIEAYLDWSPTHPPGSAEHPRHNGRYLPNARILVRQSPTQHTVISVARGGVFKHFCSPTRKVTDAGLIVETEDGLLAVSQSHDLDRHVDLLGSEGDTPPRCISVRGPLHWTRFETVTPLKQSLLHTGMWAGGRWCRTSVREFLQKRLITGLKPAPVQLTRRFEFLPARAAGSDYRLRVTDTIVLEDTTTQIRRMAFGTDHESAYVAASGVYQESVLNPWTHLSEHVAELNTKRRVVMTREF